jgi:hypothetical protein
MLDPVSCLLAYLLIGALVWMLCEPAAYIDFALSRYCARFGRLPPRGFVALAVGVMILLWPKVVVMLVRKVLAR